MKRTCITCGEDISHKRIDARFCTDACRKYFARHGSRIPERPRVADPEDLAAGLIVPNRPVLPGLSGAESADKPDKPGQVRTISQDSSPPAARSGMASAAKVMESAYRKSGDAKEAFALGVASVGLGALDKFLDRRFSSAAGSDPRNVAPSIRMDSAPPKEEEKLEVLAPGDLQPLTEEKRVFRDDAWCDFLGQIATPFKLLVWGLPGSGKSIFALRFINALSSELTCLYIADEEAPQSVTFRSRLKPTIPGDRELSIIPRLPRSGLEWADVLGSGWSARDVVVYDSITTMNLTPSAVDDAIATALEEFKRELQTTGRHLNEAIRLTDFKIKTSNVWIAHAQKDGRTYLGDAAWAHDADIVIRCDGGMATTLKNRYGQSGRRIQIL